MNKTLAIAMLALVLGACAPAYDTSPKTTIVQQPSLPPDVFYQLEIKTTACEASHEYTTISGTMTNRSAVTVYFAQLKVALSKGGSVVDTDWLYAVGAEGLAPGESTKWEWMFHSTNADQCQAELLDYEL